MVNEEEEALSGCHLTTLVTQTRHLLCSWLETERREGQLLPPLELKHPWHCADFLLQLFTDKAGRNRRPLLL